MISFAPEMEDRGYGLPTARCLNLFAEPSGQAWRMIKRPGLVQRVVNNGTGPVRGIYRTPSVREDQPGESMFILSGSEWFRYQTSIMTGIPGDDFARFAADASQMLMLAGGKVFRFQNQQARQLDVISPLVQDIAMLNGRAFYAENGNDLIRFSGLDDAAEVEGLSYFRAEGAPDKIVGLLAAAGELLVFGSQTLEPYVSVGDANNPVASSGTRYDVGCANRDTIVSVDGVPMWVGDSRAGRKVYALASGPVPISTPTVERLIDDGELINAFATSWPGHTFYVLNLSTRTLALDLATKKWAEWSSHDEGRFRIACGTNLDGEAWMGDAYDGQTWRWGIDTYRDNVENIEAVASAFIPVEATGPCPPIELQGTRGVGRTQSPQSDDPLVELRYSDDQGRTWSGWKAKRLGAAGQYLLRVIWRMLGTIKRPGRHVEVRVSDPVIVALEGLVAGMP